MSTAEDEATRPRRLVGVSTKMYFPLQRTKDYVNELLPRLASGEAPLNVDVFFIPDFTSLQWVSAQVASSASSSTSESERTPQASRSQAAPLLLLGGQNCFYEDAGAYTGEISPRMLAELGCRFVELGHAERRRLFGETDATTARKAAAVVRNRMVPLVCIGEKTRGAVAGAVDECREQLDAVLAAIPPSAELVLAYEPVWAIGQKEPAGAEHVVGVAKELRRMALGQRGRTGGVRVLYGGSAGPGLFEKLKEGVDGLFLGRFAHDVDRFMETIREVAQP